jgi:NAD(P)-dependent dehydrogenase (short-subunit alcohol dehydrogenase family)
MVNKTALCENRNDVQISEHAQPGLIQGDTAVPMPQQYRARLPGKVAIVTGAGSQGDGIGTGKAIAVVMAGEGAKVCLVDRELARAEETHGMIRAAGGESFVCVGDVTTAADCERFVAETVQRFGGVDVLVNNVGIAGAFGNFENFDEAAWDRVIDVNLKSAVLMSRFAVPQMIRRGGGAIVNISSIAGIRAHGGGFAYGPSKAAMNELSCELAVAYGRKGIRANTVAPGHIVTPMSQGLLGDQARAARRKVNTLGVDGDAWDIAAAVLFLASDEARFISGVLIPVDGGVVQTGPLAAHALITQRDTQD